ncbi:MAG: sensor histidine kinase, partial [Flavobacteriales bacterium]
DNGPGIEMVELTKIFQKFYRVGNEETRSAKGTGIGLYMVKQIVHAHRGEVSVSQVSPQGVKFQVQLPYEK